MGIVKTLNSFLGSFANNFTFYALFIILTIIIFYLLLYYVSSLKEKRIAKYSIDSLKNNDKPFFEVVSDIYLLFRNHITKLLKKSTVFSKYSLKYNRYITYDNEKDICAMDYISNKFLIAFLFIFLTIITNTIIPHMFSIFQMIFFGFIGFFVIDIYFIIYDITKKKQIEQDLLNAIIIMNNAFRSGNSTMQAIEIVSKELKGPISQEFKKMHLEISYGLSLDVVFERFSKRVESKEVNYITSSLSILNKTGGNIINVFSSIEKVLFDKRKLKQEMKSLTSSSKLVSIFLLVLPIMFIVLVSALNREYFLPLITTTVGNILLVIILLLYSIYIFVVIKIMNVRYY